VTVLVHEALCMHACPACTTYIAKQLTLNVLTCSHMQSGPTKCAVWAARRSVQEAVPVSLLKMLLSAKEDSSRTDRKRMWPTTGSSPGALAVVAEAVPYGCICA
jgi:hypothetical protein